MDTDDSGPSEASEPNKKCRRLEVKTKLDTSIRAFNFDDESSSDRVEGGELSIQHLKRSKPEHFNAHYRHYKVTRVYSPVLTRRVTFRRSSRNSVDDPQSKFMRKDEAPYFLPTEAYVEDYGNVFFFFFNNCT